MRRALIVAALLLLAGIGYSSWRPGWALEAEFARLRWQAGATEKSIDAAGHRWRYLEAGTPDAPLLVLVHGFTGMKENWLPLMRELGEDYRLIAPDLPGWNESERQPGADYGVAAQAERVAAFLAALDAPVTLLAGHSMGGHIAGLTAAAHPEQVPRLLLLSSAGVLFELNDFARRVLAGEHPFAVRSRAELHDYLELLFADPPFVPWPADLALARRRAANEAFERKVLAATHQGEEAFLLEERLGDIAVPTLVMHCRGDRVIDVSAARIVHEGIADSRLRLLDGCGHMPLMSRAPVVASALREFLAGTPVN